ncbi:MAG: helix-turn-helix transcriptional regulator [Clostridia bacterium]|nr:helix-turn-helix transcriptional regulator [Clostridia bacterium]
MNRPDTDFKLKPFRVDINVKKIANVHYFEFTNNYSTFKDKHPFKELVYVDSGSINVDAENFCGKLEAKQLLIHRNNEPHSLSCVGKEAPNVIIIGFMCDCDKLNSFSQTPYTLSNDLVKILTEIIKEGHAVFLPPYDVPNLKDMKKRKDHPFGADQMLKLKLEMFLIELIRSTEASIPRAKSSSASKKTGDISNYINTHYTEKITLDNLCFIFGTNKTTLCKNFKEAYGTTVFNYINTLRIKEAKKLMREGELSLTEISQKVGYSSIHYFSKTFKSYERQSPKDYINTIKSKLKL